MYFTENLFPCKSRKHIIGLKIIMEYIALVDTYGFWLKYWLKMSSSFHKVSLRGLSSQNQIFNDIKYLAVKNYMGVEQDSYYSNLFFLQKSKSFLFQSDGNFWWFPS